MQVEDLNLQTTHVDAPLVAQDQPERPRKRRRLVPEVVLPVSRHHDITELSSITPPRISRNAKTVKKDPDEVIASSLAALKSVRAFQPLSLVFL